MKCKLREEVSLSQPLDAHDSMDVRQVAWHSFTSKKLHLPCGKWRVSAKAPYWASISPIKIQ